MVVTSVLKGYLLRSQYVTMTAVTRPLVQCQILRHVEQEGEEFRLEVKHHNVNVVLRKVVRMTRRQIGVGFYGAIRRCPPSNRIRSVLEARITEIQQVLGEAVNALVKYFYSEKHSKSELAHLLCGERGLVIAIEQVRAQFLLTDHMLSGFLQLMAWTPVTAQLYDEPSFLRTPAHLTYLSRLLDSLNEFNFTLDPSLTYGVV
ncbi:hypothetical protein ANCDUO_08943 [Ancylostoma duodenale]|uniref:RUN domain-containing protein n=1 Tax=Ancylostoma duodenale TaxID=51022 RepID=A0A0C2GHX5_9BILA|nr:hypothetical protein ANCDUO_08943 [Ancylostoma duodenale]